MVFPFSAQVGDELGENGERLQLPGCGVGEVAGLGKDLEDGGAEAILRALGPVGHRGVAAAAAFQVGGPDRGRQARVDLGGQVQVGRKMQESGQGRGKLVEPSEGLDCRCLPHVFALVSVAVSCEGHGGFRLAQIRAGGGDWTPPPVAWVFGWFFHFA